MELRDYLRVLRLHWLSVVALTLAGLVVSAGVTMLSTPQYQASTRLFVSAQTGGSSSDLFQGSTFVQQRVQSYADIATTDSVLGPVVEELRLDETPAELAGRVSASAPSNSVLVDITVTDPSAQQAADIADAVATSLTDVISTLETPADATTSVPVRVTQVQQALVPGAPSSPDAKFNIGLGVLVGLILGVGSAVLAEAVDTRIRGLRDLRDLPVPVLAAMPFDQQARNRPLVMEADPQAVRAESFRQLRTNLQFTTAAKRVTSVVVTSSLAGEGKSTTALNLAVALADAGSRVALVDADLRRPMLATYLGLEGAAGLTTVMVGRADLDDVLQPWGHTGNLHVLTAGDVPPNPSELLGSDLMGRVVHSLEERFDTVIFDGAPLVPVTDSVVLSGLVGGVLVVVAAGRARRPLLQRSLEALTSVDARVLGLVVTMLPTAGVDSYATYSHENPGTQRRRRGLRGR